MPKEESIVNEKFNKLLEAMQGATVELQGIPYTIKIEEGLAQHNDAVGQIRYYEQEIALEPSLPPFEFFSTILHEFIEFVNKKFELDLEHHQIQVLETSLFQILVDNPWYMKSVLETLYVDKATNTKTKSKEKAKVFTQVSFVPLEKLVSRQGRKALRPVWDD